jgi:hypothetical protein
MDPERHEELEIQLSAYLDGELDDAQRQEVEALLADDPEAAELYEQLKVTRELVQSLPRAEANEEWREALRGRMERQALLGDMLQASARSRRKVALAPWIALAAVLVLSATALLYMWPAGQKPTTGDYYAMEEKQQVEEAAPEEQAVPTEQAEDREAAAPAMAAKAMQKHQEKETEDDDIPAVLADQLAATDASNLAIVELAYANPSEMQQSVQRLQERYGFNIIDERPEAKAKPAGEQSEKFGMQKPQTKPTTRPAGVPRQMTLAMNVSDRGSLKKVVSDLQGLHPIDDQWLLMVPADIAETQPATAPDAKLDVGLAMEMEAQKKQDETGGPSFTRLLKANKTMVADIHDFIDKLQNNPLYIQRQIARARQQETAPAGSGKKDKRRELYTASKGTSTDHPQREPEALEPTEEAAARSTGKAAAPPVGAASDQQTYTPQANASVALTTQPAGPSTTQPTSRLRIFLWVEQDEPADTAPDTQPSE